MFGTPILTSYSAPTAGEVVGADPFDDTDDATYARGSVASGFHHIVSAIDPTAVASDSVFVFRVSATLFTPTSLRFVANLYPPGWASGDESEPELNFTAGASPVYVAIPVADGAPQDIPVAIYDWVTEEPATASQITSYFAAGGTLLIQPNGALGGTGEVTIHRISIANTVLPYRRISQRADGLAGGARRIHPRPKSVQGSNRRAGGIV